MSLADKKTAAIKSKAVQPIPRKLAGRSLAGCIVKVLYVRPITGDAKSTRKVLQWQICIQYETMRISFLLSNWKQRKREARIKNLNKRQHKLGDFFVCTSTGFSQQLRSAKRCEYQQLMNLDLRHTHMNYCESTWSTVYPESFLAIHFLIITN